VFTVVVAATAAAAAAAAASSGSGGGGAGGNHLNLCIMATVSFVCNKIVQTTSRGHAKS
jgi:hypothetical protein